MQGPQVGSTVFGLYGAGGQTPALLELVKRPADGGTAAGLLSSCLGLFSTGPPGNALVHGGDLF